LLPPLADVLAGGGGEGEEPGNDGQHLGAALPARGRGKEKEAAHQATFLIGAVGSGLLGNRLKGVIMGVLLA